MHLVRIFLHRVVEELKRFKNNIELQQRFCDNHSYKLKGLSLISVRRSVAIGKNLLRLIAQASKKSNAAYFIQFSKMYKIWYENT